MEARRVHEAPSEKGESNVLHLNNNRFRKGSDGASNGKVVSDGDDVRKHLEIKRNEIKTLGCLSLEDIANSGELQSGGQCNDADANKLAENNLDARNIELKRNKAGDARRREEAEYAAQELGHDTRHHLPLA